MKRIDTTYRSDAAEMMDDFSVDGEMLTDALDKIAKINRLLGGNRITLDGISKLISKNPQAQYSIIDVGCGSGDMLREIAIFGRKNNIDFKLSGIDANPAAITHAISLSDGTISYSVVDTFDESFAEVQCDIILCTLTLHHFDDEQIVDVLKRFRKMARIGIVINDLQRSKMAYRLFEVICGIFSLNKMSKEDGLVSILRGFKRADLERYSQRLQLPEYSIKWRWAFRYQWLIFSL